VSAGVNRVDLGLGIALVAKDKGSEGEQFWLLLIQSVLRWRINVGGSQIVTIILRKTVVLAPQTQLLGRAPSPRVNYTRAFDPISS